MIYLATPYTHPDHSVMQNRFEMACSVAGKLMREGHIVFSPIAHTHPIAVRCELPRDWGFWHKYDAEFIEACDEVWVVRMDGWDVSRGVLAEIDIAKDFGKPVKYIDPA
jgi:hypothetical protein